MELDNRYQSVPKRDVSIPIDQIAQQALLPALVLLVAPVLIYFVVWGIDGFLSALFSAQGGIVGITGFFALVIAHEAVHAAGWVIFGGVAPADIRFGIDRASLSPYAHARTDMPATGYRIGAALPLVLTGIVPWLAALLLGSPVLMVLGALLISSAIGDLYVLWIIRAVPGSARVLDHPTQAGCYVLLDQSSSP